MAHFLTIPINENGIIADDNVTEEIKIACSQEFGTTDIFLYSHGWWTTATAALSLYNRFSTSFTQNVYRLLAGNPPGLAFPARPFGIGLHWPSMLSEDPGSLLNKSEALSYYTMEKRADTVGFHALYSILRMAVEANQDPKTPAFRFHFIGHSFGCKVVCSALQGIAEDFSKNEIKTALKLNVVLLQAAFKNDQFEKDQDYELVPSQKLNIRLLVTTSQLDKALSTQFPLAQKLNIFSHAHDSDTTALGFGGPTKAAVDLFGGADVLAIEPGFTYDKYKPTGRLAVADITPLHKANKAYPADDFGGHHSDINIPELYELIAAFLFQAPKG